MGKKGSTQDAFITLGKHNWTIKGEKSLLSSNVMLASLIPQTWRCWDAKKEISPACPDLSSSSQRCLWRDQHLPPFPLQCPQGKCPHLPPFLPLGSVSPLLPPLCCLHLRSTPFLEGSSVG